MNIVERFSFYLEQEGKSINTIKGYTLDLKQYMRWFKESYDRDLTNLYRQNVLEYISFLRNIRMLNAKTINHKVSGLAKFNAFLIQEGIQEDQVIFKTDMMKVQTSYASPTKITDIEVKNFLQDVLENKNKRNYAIVILLAYTGLRISEALSIKMNDFNLQTGECIIRNGKGEKQRVVLLNSKVIHALRDYLLERKAYSVAQQSPYLFISKKREKLDRTVVNRIFRSYSEMITPHQLRHFFCTNAIEKGFSIHEVANQAGHSNIHTTLLYTNPNQLQLKNKMELL
ncbi:tyrosine-type recombinase/integrase [Bacillus wiedmannii]|uniref:tyrosine-type recombinase/integrase n=1 Tax=Bacillus wiedmannii TaxID=1890302 RepID=UPI000BEFEB7F|nr:tyrosine-type recombinase/integrase [Bacillus wiedmannii]PEO58437.1 transposase [Bacillus wiedmannii]PGC76657.1 transposase [Bacillus wiedmannii]